MDPKNGSAENCDQSDVILNSSTLKTGESSRNPKIYFCLNLCKFGTFEASVSPAMHGIWTKNFGNLPFLKKLIF